MPPYLTEDLPGIGGIIKDQVQDFQVEELPLYPPSGAGEHTFFEIQKVGLSTYQAVGAVAKALDVPSKTIGYAGLKDAHAITCQVLSVHGVSPDRVAALDLPKIKVLWAERHKNKLKIGHLRGNRFFIRIRGVEEQAMPACQAILDVLERRGVPNWYGPQRFGNRGDSAVLGRAVVSKDPEGFIRLWLGHPHPAESPALQRARTLFDAGQWQEALNLFPGGMADERRALQALLRTEGDFQRAYASVPKRLKVFLLSAYQSALFNRVLEERLQSLDRVYAGDLAVKHPGRSVFRVEDEKVEQRRAEQFEISPSGPIFGYKMMQAEGSQGELERSLLASEGLELEDFRLGGGIRAKGTRRALRFALREPELAYDAGIVLRFWLPSGCYATAMLAELTKVPWQPEERA
ncbi:MAG: tRNA pseudouridine(13) synthase TruD [Anaerolineae bacterium]|jgi:tRNA pseudouridine13 synthase